MRAKLALLCFFLFASQALADAEISEIKIGLDGAQVLTTFTLTGAFDQRFSERVDSGLPTSILYRLKLFRDRKRWWDRRLRESTFEVVATYDAVARAYTVHYKLNDKLIESRTVRERKALEEAMTRVESLPAFSVAGLPREWRLLVKAQAERGPRATLSLLPATNQNKLGGDPQFCPPWVPP